MSRYVLIDRPILQQKVKAFTGTYLVMLRCMKNRLCMPCDMMNNVISIGFQLVCSQVWVSTWKYTGTWKCATCVFIHVLYICNACGLLVYYTLILCTFIHKCTIYIYRHFSIQFTVCKRYGSIYLPGENRYTNNMGGDQVKLGTYPVTSIGGDQVNLGTLVWDYG